ncbi:MAG: ABC transporter permease [Dehalococcoidia bacterium]|nr:ABC transporter permease [Dehalococcoidia bacterium]
MTQATATSFPLDHEYVPPRRRLGGLRRFVTREPLGTIGAVVVLLMIFGAIAAPILHTTNPKAFSADVLSSPSWDHWFGTTREGKDVWSRVLYGGRVSLKIGLSTVVISVLGGTLLALVSGYLGGIVDFVLGRITDVLVALPAILFALTLRTSIGQDVPDVPGMSQGEILLVIAICVVFTPVIFRIMRGAVLEQRNAVYVEAARVVGASELRIMFRHLLPNLAGLMIVITSTTLPAAILTESALSFLGVGVEIGTPSWGADLSGNARQFFVDAPWIAIFPGLALSLTVLAFNLLGDSLRDTLDPRLRNKR